MSEHPQKEKKSMEDPNKLIEEIFELAVSNDMNYFG
jgi:hypothetical protein